MADGSDGGIEKPRENWTRFPNCILDNLDKFSTIEIKIMCFIVRKNLGWSQPNKQFSSGYVAKRINISKTAAKAGIDSLEKKGAIKHIGEEFRGVKMYDIKWRLPLGQKMTQSEFDPDLGQNLTPVLETIDKETIEENAIAFMPQPFKDSKAKKKTDLNPLEKDLAKPIYEILDKSSYKVEHSKTLTQKIVRAIKKHGLEKIKTATVARCAFMKSQGKDLFFHSFIADEESIEWQWIQSAPSKKQSTLPVFGAGESWNYAQS